MGRTVGRRRHTPALGKSDRGPRRFGHGVGSNYSARPNAPMRNSKFEIRNPKDSCGAAIMLALWALFLLSALVISWALDINTRLSLSGSANRRLEAEAMACSGVEVAFHPLIKPS